MLVYGDAKRRRRTADLLASVEAGGPHAFFDAAGLAQGLIDAEFEVRGEDDLTPLHAAAMDLLAAMARGQAPGPALARLRSLRPPEAVAVTTPEGYAFYAVYPEAYRLAARSAEWPAPPLVIGLRSIGTGLAAVVAAETGGTALTLRPTGDPFARTVRPSPALRARLAAHGGPCAIVDEGPGLSGSSFGSVADLLEALGVAPARTVFLPSHPGDLGPQASPRHRARWATARRAVATLDDLLAAEPICGWFADLIGEASRVEDLSGGAWRRWASGEAPANARMERRKFRLTTPSGVWIARFAGLGRLGEAKLARAKALHTAGFAPEPVALRRGFLLQPWIEGAPLAPGDRKALLDHLARYLAFRARAFPAAEDEGASAARLAEMAQRNAGLAPEPPRPGPRVHVDGKLQPWEWLRGAGGRFVKLDAVDHSCAHDLVGCQPIEWDVAGAATEFGLSDAEVSELIASLERDGAPVDRDALPFFKACYAAFWLGYWAMAEGSAAERQEARYRALVPAPAGKDSVTAAAWKPP